MAEIVTLCLATVATQYVSGLAADLVPEFLGDLTAPRERLERLRQRMELATPAENNDLCRILADAFWIAILQVVAHEGEAAGASITWPELFPANPTLSAAWRSVREFLPSGPSPSSLMSKATAEVATTLYPKIIQQFQNPLMEPPNGIVGAVAQVEVFLHRNAATSESLSLTLLKEARSHLETLALPYTLPRGIDTCLTEHWLRLFRGALAQIIKRNPEVANILNATLLAEIRDEVRGISAGIDQLPARIREELQAERQAGTKLQLDLALALESRHESLERGQERILDEIRALPGRLAQIGGTEELDNATHDPATAPVDAELDFGKRLLDLGRPKAARTVLDEATPQIMQSDSAALRFRLAALNGCCHLQLDEPSLAEAHLRTAIALRPENGRVVANLANAMARLGRLSEADTTALQAWQLAPNDAYVASVYLFRLLESGRDKEFDEIVGLHSEFLADPRFLYVVADAGYRRGEFAKAISLLKDRLKTDLRFAAAWELLGRTIFAEIDASPRFHRRLLGALPEDLRRQLCEAEAAFAQALALLSLTDAGAEIAPVYLNHAAALRCLGRLDEAQSGYERALDLQPTLPEARHAMALLAMEQNEHLRARQQLAQIKPSDRTPEIITALGLAHLRTDQTREAAACLREVWTSPTASAEQRIGAVDLLAEAFRILHEYDRASEIVTAVVNEYPEDPFAQCIRAEQREKDGDVVGALSDYETIYANSTNAAQPFIAIDLANCYARLKRWSDAVRIYDTFATISMHPDIRRKYAHALVESGQVGRAAVFCRDAREQTGFDSRLAEIEIHLREETGELELANILLDEFARHEASLLPQVRIRRATNYYRQADMERARNELNEVARIELANVPPALMQAAKLRHWLGMGEVLDYAYDAWTLGRSRPEIALSYALITLDRQNIDRATLEVRVAGLGSRVKLIAGQEHRIVDIVGPKELQSHNAIRIDSIPGRALLGHQSGDRVEIGDRQYEITEVQSKYVAAHQDVFRDFPFVFPEHPGLQRMDIDLESPAQLLAMLDERSEYASKALRLYQDKQLSAGRLSKLLGDSTLNIWSALTAVGGAEHLVAAEASDAEIRDEGRAAMHAVEVVLEPTALYTLALLNLLPVLTRRFRRVIVAQQTLDELLECQTRAKFAPESRAWMGKVGDRYVFKENTDETHNRQHQEWITCLVTFVTSQATIRGCPSMLDVSSQQLKHLQETLGTASVCSALLAREHGLPLFADDWLFRAYAAAKWDLPRFWTQRFLTDVRVRGLLSSDQYYEAIETLVSHRYHFVQIDSQYLLRLLAKYHLEMPPEVMRGVALLSDPACSFLSAVNVGADVIAACWSNALPSHFKELILDGVLGALLTGRATGVVLPAFESALGARLNNDVAQQVRNNITLWKRVIKS